MNPETKKQIRLGLFLIAGLIFLVVGLYMIGKNRNLFGRTFTLAARFENIGGLQRGNNVRFSGIDVGTVDKIVILNDSTIEVLMTIEVKMMDIIRTNSVATIGTDGLMGNKLINIQPGTSDAAFVEEGSLIPSRKDVDTEEMLRTLESTNLNIELITENLLEITKNINSSRGTLYTLLLDTGLSSSLRATIENVNHVSENLNSFSYELNSITANARKGKGTLGALLSDSSKISNDLDMTMSHLHQSSERIEEAAKQLNEILEKIKSGDGSASVIINDTVMAKHLKRSIEYIDSSAVNFNQNMEALKRSFLTRGYFKRIEREKSNVKK